MKAAIFLTNECNLKCSYCFAGTFSAKTAKTMTEETLEQSVALLLKYSPDTDTGITMFGGEPLLRKGMIERLIEICDKAGKGKISLYISTNGTLVDKKFINLCKEKNIGIFLSLDGIKEAHNSNRKYSAGKGSFDIVTAKIPEILKALPYTVVASVITPDTAKYAAKSVEFLFSLNFRYILMTPDFNARWARKDLEVLKQQYLITAELYKKLLKDGKKVYLSLFDERIKTQTAEKNCPANCCDLAATSIAIAPSGNIYPCVQFVKNDTGEYCIGNVSKGFDEEKRQSVVKQNYAPREGCEGCVLDGRCFNWCGCVNWRNTGKLNKVPAFVCEHERMLLPIADEIGNTLYAEKNELFLRKFYDKDYIVASFIEDCYLKT